MNTIVPLHSLTAGLLRKLALVKPGYGIFFRRMVLVLAAWAVCAVPYIVVAQEALPVADTQPFPQADGKEIDRAAKEALAPAVPGRVPPATIVGGTWIPLGPASTLGGQVTVPPNNEIAGCIQAVAVHPTNADIIYIGSIGGGVWKTTNATNASPSWTPLTDTQVTLNIGAVEFDPADVTRQTLVVGTARTSSFAARGGALVGVLRTTDGGNTWSTLGTSVFSNENLTSVAGRGNILLAASDNASAGNGSGLFRSTDTGGSFTLVSGGSGLSAGPVSDLVGDPNVSTRFFAAVRTGGIFRSSDTGATWTNVTGTITGISASTQKIEMAMFNNGVSTALYVAVLNSTALESLWRSTDLGATWTQMDTPVTGGQTSIHFAIAADPTNASLVYVGGQTARFRGNASLPLGSQFVSIQGANSGNTTPHADPREMFIDPNGNLVECSDGGIYRLMSPQATGGVWASVNGNLAIFEAHDVAYDSVTNITMIGTQDNGTHIQNTSASTVWSWISGGDGGDVAIDDTSSPGQSIRYGSSQNLGGFYRKTYNSSNTLVSTVFPALTLLSGSPAISAQFVTPVEVNKVAPTRLAIGGSNSVYESLDQGGSVTALSVGFGVNRMALAYGGRQGAAPNPDVLYFGSGSTVRQRTTSGGLVTATPTAFPGGTVQDVILDSNDWTRVFVADSSAVYVTPDSGTTWQNITGNLTDVGTIRCLEFFNLNGTDCVAAGTGIGVYVSYVNNLGVWFRLGTGMPNAVAFDMSYNATDKVLVVGTLGRSAYLLNVGVPTLTVGPNINITKSSENNAETFISIDPTNPLRLFATSTVGANVFRYSADGGATWNNSNISGVLGGGSGGDQQSAWDSFGNLFVTYFAGASNHTVLALSTNGGASFSLLVDTGALNDQPNVAVGPGAVWFDYTSSGRRAQGAAVTGLGAVGAFSAPQTMPGTPGTFGDLAIGPAGQVLNVYQTQTGVGPSTIFANLNPIGVGGTFGAQITVTSTNVGDFAPIPSNPDRTIDAEAGLALDRSGGPRNGRVYLVYTDRPNTSSADTDIYVRFSDNNGTTWTSPVRVNDDTVGNGKSQWFPRIALDQTTGNIAVAFYDCRNSAGNNTVQLWATVSTDGGLTFLPNIQVSTGTTDGTVAALGTFDLGDYNGLDFNAGVFYPSWADNSNSTGDNPAGAGGTTDIYTARVTVGGGPTGPEIAVEQPLGTGLVDGISTSNFGVLPPSGSATQTFTVRNLGGTNLTGLSVSKDGANSADFTVGSLGATTLAPGTSTTFTVTFAPGVLGARSAAIHIASNDADESPFDIALGGSSAFQEIAVEQPVGTNLVDGTATRDYGFLTLGSNASLTFTIRNLGGADLTGLSVSKNGANSADYTIGSLGAATLAAGASTTFTVTFAPSGQGVRNAAIQIASNDADENPFDIALSGTGYVPEIAVEQPEGTDLTDGVSSIDFGNVFPGAIAVKRFAVRNAGIGPLTLSSPTVNGLNAAEFTMGTLTATTLQAGGVAYLDVTFAPLSASAKSAALHFVSTDPDESPFDISLIGTGVTLGGPISLTRDINRTFNGLSPGQSVVVGSLAFFTGTTINEGAELWRTDGTAAGTFLVKDIFVGTTSGSVSGLTNFNGALYFAANNSTNGTELWKSDGTNAGTVLVKDIATGTTSSSPANFTVVGTTLFFSAFDSTNGTELWKTDGTAAGTVLVANISTTPTAATSSSPSNFRAVGSTLFFTANDGVNGTELWKSDGTAAGTVLVKDIVAGATSSSPTNLNALGSTLIFAVNDTVNGTELWASDGTTAGTALMKDINAGSVSSSPANFVSMGGALYFTATSAAEGNELWKTDGTAAGTTLVKDIYPGATSSTPSSLTVVGSTLYFSGSDPTNGREPWKSDGTTVGTVLLRDIATGTLSSSPTLFTQVGGTVFFSGVGDGSLDRELWKTDGTSGGTVLVKDINPGSGGSAPASFVNLLGTLIFSASDGLIGQEPWKSDGTTNGTVPILDGQSGSNTASVANLRAVNGTLFFSASDGVNGQELWKSDGTIAGTVLVSNIASGANSSSPANLTNIGSTLYFTAFDTTNGTELWKSNGTAAGTVLVANIAPTSTSSSPTLLTPVGATLFFSANDATNGAELWKSDGTAAGTAMVLNINATAATGSSLANLTNFNGTLFFSANDGVNGQELWKSDGTAAGTVLVLDINPGSSSSTPSSFRVIGSTLYFTATTSANGTELWKTDGTAAGTVLVTDLVAGTGSSALGNLTVVGSTLYFSATVSASGNELWKTDGTPVGTVLVADIVAGAGSSSPTSLVAVGGMLYFSAFESTNGRELWKSDGTAAGTVLVSNINPGTASSSPVIITDVNYNGTAYFNATTAAGGAELWKSDGTGAGTALIADLMAGTISSGPANLTVLGNLLFFTARGPELGSSELFVLQASPSPEIVIEQPVGTNLVDGISAINFGAVAIGSNGTRQFTIRNTGSGNLTVSGITIDGTNPGDFTVTASPTSPVTPSGSTTFTVQFAPAAAGQRAANLHIANSDSDENPFDIALAGFALQTIGPDAFGYVGTSNVAFTFTDISATGTVILDGADDSSVNVPVGFGFSYYGTAYSSVYVSSNVLMTFGASNTAYSNTNLTTTSIGQPAIAVMWDDWVTNASATDKVYYATSGSAGSRVFTVQWDVTPYSGGGEAIVQCQLFEATGQILLNYLDVQTGNSASNGANSTIGIQDTGGNANGRVLQWSFNTASVFDGMSILFSPRDANLSNLLPSSGTLSPAFTSGITTYSESVSNATASIAVTPTALKPNSTIQVRVNGGAYSAVASGASSGSLPLNIGVNSVDVLVTAQDTVTTKLYSIAATRRTPYQDWAVGLGLSGAGLDPNGDFDGDAMKNIHEWAFGTNPSSGAQGPIAVGAGVLLAHGSPTVLPVPDGLGGVSYFALFGRRKDAAAVGLTYVVEFSDRLSGWTISGITATVVAQDSEIEAVIVPFPPTFILPPSGYFRIGVTAP